MTNLSELIQQREQLEREINQARDATRAQAINEVRDLMRQHNITAEDITKGFRAPAVETPKRVVEPKYRDNEGNTWSGRGLTPRWLQKHLAAGKQATDFLINKP